MAYRAPISRGYDAIGAAVGGGLAAGASAVAAGLEERRRRALEEEERARRERLDRMAEEDRQRQIGIQNAELGVVSEREAMQGDPIERAVVGSRAPVATLAPPRLGTSMNGPTFQGGPQTPQMRPGVIRAGEMFIDPTKSLDYRRQQIEREETRREQNREIEEKADRYQQLDPTMTRGDAIARAAGLSTAEPITQQGVLAQRKLIAEQNETFTVRGEGRENAEWERRERLRDRLDDDEIGKAAREDSAEGYALTAATEALRIAGGGDPRRSAFSAGSDPESFVRNALRQAVARGEIRLQEGQIRQLATLAVARVQDQQAQHAPEVDEFGDEEEPVETPRTSSTDRATLLRAQAEWDAEYAEVQSMTDPRKRAEAKRLLGTRPR